MKHNYYLLIFLMLGFGTALNAQQPSPIGILFNPRVNTFAVSGVGGGNMYELAASKSSTSGQVAVDFNVGVGEGESKRGNPRTSTITSVFKFNPFLQRNYVSGDSLEMRKIAFVDNEFQFFLGFRFAQLTQLGNDESGKFQRSLFADFSFAPYQVADTGMGEQGFYNLNFNLGYQFGLLKNTDFGLVGVQASPLINYVHLADETQQSMALEWVTGANSRVSRNYLGTGIKLMVPINDFVFFMDGRKYWNLENGPSAPGLADRLIFSVGGIATGTVFKNRTEEGRL